MTYFIETSKASLFMGHQQTFTTEINLFFFDTQKTKSESWSSVKQWLTPALQKDTRDIHDIQRDDLCMSKLIVLHGYP